MEQGVILAITVAVMVVLLFSGITTGLALTLGGMLGLLLLYGVQGAAITVPQVLFDALNDFVLIAIPLFVMMGVILAKGGIGGRLYDLFDALLRHIPGGVGMATILTCMVLAAMCGTSSAISAMVGAFALTNMRRLGYSLPLSIGAVVGGGALGILIPPSVSMIIFGAITGESVGKLFMAGILPGLIAVGFFCVYMFFAFRKEQAKGLSTVAPPATRSEKWQALKRGYWGILIPAVIIGLLYGGVATPTEIAALGCILSLIVSMFVYRTIPLKKTLQVLKEGTNGAVMIMFIICGAILFANVVTQLGLPSMIASVYAGHSLPFFIVTTMLMLLAAGCFLEGASMMLIFLPILFPTVLEYGYSLIVYAVIMTINMECAFLTPPVGLNLYAVDGIAKAQGLPSTVGIAIKGSWPYVVMYLAVLVLVIAFPQIALFLPTHM